MKKLLIGFIIFGSVLPWSTAMVPAAQAQTTNAVGTAYPSALIIPSINLFSPIQNVGMDNQGAMAVPSGATNNVGWYEYGTTPGAIGSAVLDAHIFAAFSNLKYVAPGNDIFVLTQTGHLLHFIVSRVQTYPNAKVPLNILFNQADGQYLNLITCAGKLTPDHSTYDSRLVVYAKLAA